MHASQRTVDKPTQNIVAITEPCSRHQGDVAGRSPFEICTFLICPLDHLCSRQAVHRQQDVKHHNRQGKFHKATEVIIQQLEGSTSTQSQRAAFATTMPNFSDLVQTSIVWNGAEAIVVPVGASSEELRYHKSIALQVWLYGYEIPGNFVAIHSCCCYRTLDTDGNDTPADTIMLFTKEALYVLTSTKKGDSFVCRLAMTPVLLFLVVYWTTSLCPADLHFC